MPLGIVMRKTPGVTRWVRWNWTPVAVLPGADPAHWKLMRSDGEAEEFHAATLNLTLHAADAEAYMHGLSANIPSIYVVMRLGDPLDFVLVTASPYEAQDYAESGEEIVEKVPMTRGLLDFVQEFSQLHYEEEVFVKRRRDKARVDRREDGKGDARITQMSDIYRAPGSKRKARLS
ncbi:MAG: DUF3305 domain-containing protein [Litoreibacter sp.]